MTDGGRDDADGGWSHNVHYQQLVLDAVDGGTGRAVDVGCGEGGLCRRLAAVVPTVVGLDAHAPTITVASSRSGPPVEYVLGDLRRHPFRPMSFDLVASIAALHHMPTGEGLERLAELVA